MCNVNDCVWLICAVVRISLLPANFYFPQHFLWRDVRYSPGPGFRRPCGRKTHTHT